jgi:hypothetical protein
MVKRAVPAVPVEDPYDEKNHPKFQRRVYGSRPAVLLMAEWVEENFWMQTKVPDEFVVDKHRDHKKGADKGDFSGTYDGIKEWRFEVKHRHGYEFTTRWPFPTLYICTCYSFDRADPKPYGYFHVSKSMKFTSFVIVDATRDKWTTKMVEDKYYDKPQDQIDNPAVYGEFTHKAELNYIIPREYLIFYDLSTKRPPKEDHESRTEE